MCDPPSIMSLGVKSLLGLGVKYYVRMPRPTNKIKNTIDCLKRNLRLNWYFKYHPPDVVNWDGPSYIPSLYIVNNGWEPPKCNDLALKKAITSFKVDLQTKYSKAIQPCYNIQPDTTPLEAGLHPQHWWQSHLRWRWQNIGGCLLRYNIYNYRGTKEHLGDTNIYKPLTKRGATQHLHIVWYKYDIFVAKWKGKGQLSKAE